jgi:C1A family cysteine protease
LNSTLQNLDLPQRLFDFAAPTRLAVSFASFASSCRHIDGRKHEFISSVSFANRPHRREGEDIVMTSMKDPTKEEQRHLGYVPGPGELSLEERERVSREAYERPAQLRAAGEAALPPQWDWRAKDGRNFISPPKNQGNCGACTAFAAASAIDAKMRIDLNIATGDPGGGLMPDLSEAQLFFCGGTGDCGQGSNVETLMKYARDTGVVPETAYPYSDLRGCRISVVKGWQSLVSKISGWKTLELKSGGTAAMKEWISTKGPLATAMYPVYADFQSFSGDGVYRWNGSSPKVEPDGRNQGHAVCVIGYDENRKAWLIKNSWGSGWGSGGFAYVAYSQCGIDAQMWGVDGLATTYPFFKTTGLPSACVYGGQTHFCYCDTSGAIRDVIWTGSSWTVQQIAGPGSLSGGPAAAGNPAVVAFNGEMHCFYRELGTNEIWDAEWSGNTWFSFQLTGKGLAGGPPARGDSNPTVAIYGGQIHCFYRVEEGFAAHEIISGTNWTADNVTSLSGGPPALSDPAVIVHDGAGFNQLHCCYRDSTNLHQWKTGNVFDSLYDNKAGKWLTMQVTGAGGKADGAPEAFGALSVVLYGDQTHYCYRDLEGAVWNVTQGGDSWTPQKVTGSGGKISAAPAAAGDPFVIVWGGSGYKQMHYCYRDAKGAIWDAQWTGSQWLATQVTGAGGQIPGAPAAADGPFVFVHSDAGYNKMHYCYRDKDGYIQDVFWNGSAWGYQTI